MYPQTPTSRVIKVLISSYCNMFSLESKAPTKKTASMFKQQGNKTDNNSGSLLLSVYLTHFWEKCTKVKIEVTVPKNA